MLPRKKSSLSREIERTQRKKILSLNKNLIFFPLPMLFASSVFAPACKMMYLRYSATLGAFIPYRRLSNSVIIIIIERFHAPEQWDGVTIVNIDDGPS